jgi:hypothetical protein
MEVYGGIVRASSKGHVIPFKEKHVGMRTVHIPTRPVIVQISLSRLILPPWFAGAGDLEHSAFAYIDSYTWYAQPHTQEDIPIDPTFCKIDRPVQSITFAVEVTAGIPGHTEAWAPI